MNKVAITIKLLIMLPFIVLVFGGILVAYIYSKYDNDIIFTLVISLLGEIAWLVLIVNICKYIFGQ